MSWREWIGMNPTEADFAHRIISVATKQGNKGWKHDGNSRTLVNSKHEGVVNCVNIYLEYCNSPKSVRSSLLSKYVSLLQSFDFKVPELWGMAAKNVFPAIRSRHMLTTVEINHRGTTNNFPAMVQQSLAGDLQVMMMYDHGQQLATLSEEIVSTWGQQKESLFKQAMANLRTLPKPRWIQENEHVYRLNSDVSYEETFMLLPELAAPLPFKDNAILMVPNRGVLIAANGADSIAIRALLNCGADCMLNKPWPLSGMIYSNINGVITAVTAPPDLHELAHMLEVISISSTYDAQKTCLESYYQRIGVDQFVATFNVASKQDTPGRCRSWCFWGENISSVLPKTDLIAFGKNAGTDKQITIMVPWDKAVEICGDYMRRTNDDPERHQVNEFPTERQWQELLNEQQVLSEQLN